MSIPNIPILLRCDNNSVEAGIVILPNIDLLYADMIYEDTDFSWIDLYWSKLNFGGVFIVQTDWHTVFELGVKLKSLPDARFVNHLVWKNEWGNHPKDRFHQCFDDIIIVSRGTHFNFHNDTIQVPKATMSKGLNPSGRQTKTATAFINDICLSTVSKERIKKPDGHLVQWQKPVALLRRLFSPFVNPGYMIVDPFMGTATSCVVAMELNCNYVGIENDPDVYQLAYNRIFNKDGEEV